MLRPGQCIIYMYNLQQTQKSEINVSRSCNISGDIKIIEIVQNKKNSVHFHFCEIPYK